MLAGSLSVVSPNFRGTSHENTDVISSVKILRVGDSR